MAFDLDHCMRSNEARYVKYHDFGKSADGKVIIPNAMTQLFIEDDWVQSFPSLADIPFTPSNIEHLMQIYIQAVYFEHWYRPGASSFTMQSIFFPLDATEEDRNIEWDHPKFVRLNSVSPKHRKPVFSLAEAREVIALSDRCQEAIVVAKHYGFSNLIVIRDWKEMQYGNEYRCFIYNDQLTAITNHDGNIKLEGESADESNEELIERVQNILTAARYFLPHTTICMDVFVHFTHPEEDCVIEFSAYGAATDTGSGAFHWLTDRWELANSDEVTVRLD